MELIKIGIVCTLLLAYVNAVCVHNDIEYQEGETYIDDCNPCTCGGGCHKMACPPKVCASNGQMYGVGEQFMDACNRCTCGENGESACTLMAC